MHIAFGHSIQLEPVQLLAVFSSLINGGMRVPPRAGERVVSEATSLTMRRMLRNAVADGRSRRADVPGLAVGGTIGVMIDPGNPIFFVAERRFPAFIGAFPITEPRYALLVMLEQPNVADKLFDTAAAPVAAKIIARIAPLLAVAQQPLDRR
ncbi:MAG: penicillin-binding transpeptidase domain-containing protein [Rhodospirillaceae bacterium]